MRKLGISILLAACGPEEVVDEGTECEGAGEPTLTLGTGSLSTFVAFEDGDSVAVTDAGVQLALLTTGLDTTSPVTAVLKVGIGGDNADAIASLSLQCPEEGPGWIQVVAGLPAGVDAASVSGMTLTLDGVATDGREVTASAEPVDLVVK